MKPAAFPTEIEFEGTSRSRSLQKLLDRKVRRWLASVGASGTAFPKVIVRLESEPTPGASYVSCQVEVKLGDRDWSASWYGRNPAQALAHCLQHMSERRSGWVLAPA